MGNKNYILKLDVEGWLAQFRSPSTVTTQLTHIVPPKSTMIGILLARAGYIRPYKDNWEIKSVYEKLIDVIKIGISYDKKDVTKYIDYIQYRTKKGIKPTNVEYLVNPKYTLIYEIPLDPIEIDYLKVDLSPKQVQNEILKTYFGRNEAPILTNDIYVIEDYTFETTDRIRTKYVFQNNENIKSISGDYISEDLPITPPLLKETNVKDPIREFIVPLGNYVKVKFKSQQKIAKINGEELILW